jgi:hypothetical protein
VDVVLFCTALGALVVSGALAAAILGARSLVAFVLTAYVVGWLALAAVESVLSIGSQLHRWAILTGLLAVAGSVTVLWVARGRSWRPHGQRALRAVRAGLESPALAVLGTTVGLALVYLVALALITPPNDWDGLTYHVTRAALWEQEAGIGLVQAGNEPRLNGNPPLAEIGMYLSIGLGRTDRWLALPQLLGLLASAFGVVGLARRVGLSHPEAMFAALTFVTLPVVLLQGQSVMNDLVLTSFLLAATYFLLGRERHDGLLGALALALALSTKFTAALLLPLVVLVALAGSVGRRRLRTVGWAVVGILVSAPWYVLNLVDTGHLDGDLARLTGQQAEHSLAAIVTTLRALAIDTIDLSGADAENGIVFFIVGTAIGVAGATAGILRRDRRLTLSSLGAAVTVMVLPAAMAAVDGPLMRSYQKVWLLLGRDDIAYREPSNWVTATIADTSRSWYGPVGTLAVFGGLAIAIQAVRRGSMRPLALVLALAPAVAIAIFAVTIPWDPWRDACSRTRSASRSSSGAQRPAGARSSGRRSASPSRPSRCRSPTRSRSPLASPSSTRSAGPCGEGRGRTR